MNAKLSKTSLLVALTALVLSACAVPTPAPQQQPPAQTETQPQQPAAQPTEAPAAPSKVAVRVVLQWVPQSQFAGYYAAKDKGFYEAEGLDVTIIPGGPDIAPAQVVASGGAEFGVAWLPGRMLAAREGGADLVNIAQIFQRSGTLMVSFKEKNITKIEDFKGKNVGSWLLGNEAELFAALRKFGLDPEKDVNIVKQNFDMSQLLNGEVDVAQAMIYNEYAQVLETRNPKTGELYKPEELNVIDFNEVGTAMLQDGVMARESWLAQPGNEDIAVRFLRATFRGWMFCRDNFDECVQIVLNNGTALGESHMRWQLNEVNALIWPSPNGIGIMDENLYKQTVEIAKTYGILKRDPDPGAYRTDLAKKALEGLEGDTKGLNFKKITVELKEGGN
ncbi:MAG: ABC transporter substrate-binding protein [Thermoflexales bacterium]|nr:ABC transporter substrate-binding protein [Thermoflexales bacterium]MCS7325219.1 ABC transporter substrate-binding protein [Thermoflexales bacterium]MDW8053355.1 ABC transporter substrate-binding protein [Anaerolineae bacterium]MDW8292008.1 ABC transporter substrate-binding protein [Anaerolineae bacterium]